MKDALKNIFGGAAENCPRVQKVIIYLSTSLAYFRIKFDAQNISKNTPKVVAKFSLKGCYLSY